MTASSDGSLSGQDLAFLAWESSSRPMHIGATAEFDGVVDAPDSIEALRTLLRSSLVREPALARRLIRRRFRTPRWRAPEAVDLSVHVRALSEVARPDETVESTRARVLARALDPSRPLWEIWLETVEGAGRVRLHFKFHHVVADGIGALALLERILGTELDRERSGTPEPEGEKRPAPSAARTVENTAQAPNRKPVRRDARRPNREGSLLDFIRQHLTRGIRTPLTGPVGAERTYHSVQIDATSFQAWRATLGVSSNDALLALVAVALERWLAREGDGPVPRHLRAFCPVSLRTPGERSGGNRIAPWFVPLPLSEGDLTARARAIHSETRRLRSQRAERGGDRMAKLVRRCGAWLAGLGMAAASWRNAFDLVVTNVPGPRSELSLAGGGLSGLAAYPPLFPGQRVCLALVQTRDRWTLGLHTGFRDEGRAERLAASLQEAFDLAGIELPEYAPTRPPLHRNGSRPHAGAA